MKTQAKFSIFVLTAHFPSKVSVSMSGLHLQKSLWLIYFTKQVSISKVCTFFLSMLLLFLTKSTEYRWLKLCFMLYQKIAFSQWSQNVRKKHFVAMQINKRNEGKYVVGYASFHVLLQNFEKIILSSRLNKRKSACQDTVQIKISLNSFSNNISWVAKLNIYDCPQALLLFDIIYGAQYPTLLKLLSILDS